MEAIWGWQCVRTFVGIECKNHLSMKVNTFTIKVSPNQFLIITVLMLRISGSVINLSKLSKTSWRKKNCTVLEEMEQKYSQYCLNDHLFQPVTCLYGQLSVTSLQFYYLFVSCITINAYRGHGQPFWSPKWPLTGEALWRDNLLSYLQDWLWSLFFAISSHAGYLHVGRPQTLCKQVWSVTIVFICGTIC